MFKGFKLKMSNCNFHQINFYKFKLQLGTAQTIRNINKVWVQGTSKECTMQCRFQQFCSGDIDFEDKEGHSSVDNDQLRSTKDEDPTKTTQEMVVEHCVNCGNR